MYHSYKISRKVWCLETNVDSALKESVGRFNNLNEYEAVAASEEYHLVSIKRLKDILLKKLEKLKF